MPMADLSCGEGWIDIHPLVTGISAFARLDAMAMLERGGIHHLFIAA